MYCNNVLTIVMEEQSHGYAIGVGDDDNDNDNDNDSLELPGYEIQENIEEEKPSITLNHVKEYEELKQLFDENVLNQINNLQDKAVECLYDRNGRFVAVKKIRVTDANKPIVQREVTILEKFFKNHNLPTLLKSIGTYLVRNKGDIVIISEAMPKGREVTINDVNGCAFNFKQLYDFNYIVSKHEKLNDLFQVLFYTVKYLHQRMGIVHKDIHPKNIIANLEQNRVILIDLGDSCLLHAPSSDLQNLMCSARETTRTHTDYIPPHIFEKLYIYNMKIQNELKILYRKRKDVINLQLDPEDQRNELNTIDKKIQILKSRMQDITNEDAIDIDLYALALSMYEIMNRKKFMYTTSFQNKDINFFQRYLSDINEKINNLSDVVTISDFQKTMIEMLKSKSYRKQMYDTLDLNDGMLILNLKDFILSVSTPETERKNIISSQEYENMKKSQEFKKFKFSAEGESGDGFSGSDTDTEERLSRFGALDEDED